MLKKLADRISVFLVQKGACEQDKQEIVSYGMLRLFNDAVQLVTLVVVSLIFHTLPSMCVFLPSYVSLRGYIGGAHAGTHLRCLSLFTFVALCASLAGTHVPTAWLRQTSAVLSVFSMIVVFARAPVIHRDTHKSDRALRRFKMCGRIVVCIQLTLALIFCLLPNPALWRISLWVNLGGASASATILVPSKSYIKWREVQGE